MIDHVTFPVKDYDRSLQWYLKALKPLNYELRKEIEHEGVRVAGLGEAGEESTSLWILQGATLLDGAPDSSSDAALVPVARRPLWCYICIGVFPDETCHTCLPVSDC